MKNIYILLFAAFSLQSTPVEMDYRSACEAQSDKTFGKIVFDGKDCRCNIDQSMINPFKTFDTNDCIEFTTLADKCRNAGDFARFVMLDGILGIHYGKCFCVRTGQFMNTKQFEAELEKCQYASDPSYSSYEVGQRLHYYLSGLPSNVKPLVDLKSLKSIFEFLHPTQSSRTVKIVGQKTGLHGGIVYVYRLKWQEKNWLNVDDPVGQQLDPTMSVKKFGPFIGRFFGFEKIDDNTYTIPSLDEYLCAIKAINQNGPVVSGTAFDVVGQFGQKEYIQKFVNEGALPASEFLPSGDQTYFFHDMALHLASLVIYPPELYKSLQLFTKQHREAFELANQKDGDTIIANIIDGVSVIPLFSEEIPKGYEEQANQGLSIFFSKGQRNTQLLGQQLKSLNTYSLNEIGEQLSTIPMDPHFTELENKMSQVLTNTTEHAQSFFYLLNEHREHLTRTIEDITRRCRRVF